MDFKKQDSPLRDDLSDIASSIAEERTLHDEPLPSYDEAPASLMEFPPEKSVLVTPAHDIPEQVSRAHYPSAADPFAFPSPDPSTHSAARTISRPLAIPQVSPSAAAPLLPAYPTALLSVGITAESWRSFVDTVSAFLSAKISQQAVHHAADIASNIGDFHKQYALRMKANAKNITQSAKSFNPGGVIGNTLGITFGSIGHVVTSGFQAVGSLRLKPQTPRERAAVYIEAANLDWFHSRGLHAALMDTIELSALCEASMPEMLSAAVACGSTSARPQLAALQEIIGEMDIQEAPRSNATPYESAASYRKAAGKRPVTHQLELGATTLWLVLVQKEDYLAPDLGPSLLDRKPFPRRRRAGKV